MNGGQVTDETEGIRRKMIAESQPDQHLAECVKNDGKRYNGREELLAEFDVTGFLAPFVVVTRKSDGRVGTMEFTHNPRVYFNFEPDNGAD